MKIVKSPIFWLSIIVILITIPLMLYYFTVGNSGGMGLAGLIALIVAITTIFILFLEQLLINSFKINSKAIWIVEPVIIIGLIFVFLHTERKIIYTVDENIDWFVTIYSKNGLDNPIRKFPFDLNYIIDNKQNLFIDNSIEDSFSSVRVISWNGYTLKGDTVIVEEQKYRFRIYYHPRVKPQDQNVDEIKIYVINKIKEKL